MRQRTTALYRTRVKLRVHSLAQLIDTMRYEAMVPDTEADSRLLEGTLFERGGVEVTMRRYSMNPGPPNEDRLRSFSIALVSWEPVT